MNGGQPNRHGSSTDPVGKRDSLRIAGWLALASVSALLIVGTSIVGSILMGDINLFWPVLLVAWPAVGGLLAVRTPGHLVSKLLIVFSVFFSVATSAETYVFMSQSGIPLPGTEAMAWLSLWAITPIVTLLTLLVAVFPSGHLASRWLHWPLRVSVLLTSIALLGRAVLPVETAAGSRVFVNPWGVESLAFLVPFEEAGLIVVILLAGLVIVDLVVRWRRSTGLERLQMRALAVTVAAFLVAVLTTTALALTGLPESVINAMETLAWLPGLAAVPIAIGVAVLRYRLYEIDRIVSRTVTYALVAGLLALVFFAIVTLLSSLLPAESDVAVAASTLAVAALFNPLRRRVRRWVDRRFNRTRYAWEQIISEYTGSLNEQTTIEGVLGGLLQTVATTIQPATVSVWHKSDDGRRRTTDTLP